MNVLHILFSRGWGGLERYAIEQARAMADRGHAIAFLRRTGTQTAARLAELNVPGEEWDPVKYIDLRAIAALRHRVRKLEIDIVHAHHSADLGLAAPALWRVPNTRLIFSSYMQVPGPKRDLYHRLEYGKVNRLLTLSDGMRENAIANLPAPPERIVVMPYGVDMSRYDPEAVPRGAIREACGVGPQRPIVGVLGRLDPHKGQMEMIMAMPAILAKVPGAALVLAGNETPELAGVYRARLQAAVKERGLESSVFFTGPTEKPASALADFDVFVMASHSETLGMVTVEAMAMRRAIVGTNAGGTPEMLDHGACGLLAEPRNPASLAQNVIRLLSDKALAASLAEKARDTAMRRYDRERAMDRLDAIYRGDI